MKRIIIFLIFTCVAISITAQRLRVGDGTSRMRITHEYNNVSLSDALRQLNAEATDYEINFLYNELEDFRITTSVHRKTIPDAIRQMIGFYPIRMSIDSTEITIECPQKTANRYKGSIIDEQGQPVAYANIALLNPADSTLLSGGVSNASGYFAVPCEQHPVLARISYVGYKTMHLFCNHPEMGTIRMQPDNIRLKDIKITGNAIQNSASGYKVNVKSLLYAKDRMLTDLLPYLPGINIDQEKITILGKAATAYYIDGIRNTDPAVLKSLSSERIETIEVDYLAGVDESKSAVGGVIRITTRRDANNGYIGDVRGSLMLQPSNGLYDQNIANTMSASIGKLYVFNRINLTHNTPKIHEEETYDPKPNSTMGYSTDRQGKYKRTYLNEYLGFSYEISQSQQLKGSTWYAFADEHIHETALTSKADGTHISSRQNPNQSHVVQGVTDYVWKPKPEQQFDFIVDYLYKRQSDRQHSVQDNEQAQEYSQVQNTHMLRIQPKWQQPLCKALNLTTGLDYQQTHYSNNLWVRTTMNSYSPAAFAKIEGEAKSIQYEIGLRAQHTSMRVRTDDVKNNHSDFGIFPTVNFMWMINQKRQHMLNLMYKYSMEDLPYSAISTYRSYTSPYSYETGNPSLKPPTGHELMLMAKLWGKWTLLGGFIRSNNEIYFVREQSPESPSVTQIMPYNCAHIEGLMFGMEYLLRIGEVWSSIPKVQMIHMSGQLQGEHYSNPFTYRLDWRNYFRFSSTFSAALDFHYEPTSHYLDHTLKPVYHVNIQLAKSLYNERLLFTLETKPFVKNRRSITDNLNVRTTYHNLTREQYFEFIIKWRFKGGKHLKKQSTVESIQEYKQLEKEK